jgi:EPS-associated MarR family transcriptional regulator
LTCRQAKQHEDTCYGVISIFRDKLCVTHFELSEKLGLILSSLNYCLKALIDKDWVKIQNFSNNKNKLGYICLHTLAGTVQKATLTSSFLQGKIQEYKAFNKEIKQMKQKFND